MANNNLIIPGSMGSRLVAAGIITEEQLAEALEIQKTSKELIGTILTQLGYCTEDDIAKTLAKKTGYKYVSINEIGVNVSAANLITPEMALRNHILPLYQDEKTLYVAMKNPNDIITIDNLHLMTGLEICPLVAPDMELTAAIENFANMNSSLDNYDEDEVSDDQNVSEEFSIDDKPAVLLVNQIINNAIKAGASDIHVEALEKHMRVRRRAYEFLFQISGTTVRFEDRTLDIRIATMPTVYGEKIVMRLLERSQGVVKLHDLHFSERQFPRFEKAIHMPYGFLLVTGPTGSGKSTTLYATLAEISSDDKNTITLEDPVERRMAGINQVQMNNRAGMTFAAALRSVLRSDPDIVMVGEIRDGETAKIAVEAALTGHMVLSTLHTNDAPGAVTRLNEMGVEPFLVTSSLVGVLAQRLVRRLCPKCKEAYQIKRDDLLKIFPDLPLDEYPDEEFTLYKPKGCITCNNTGYKGREAVFEFLTVTEEMKELILDRANAAAIKELAVKQGMHTLKDEGIYKVMHGKTSIEEILRVIV